MPVTLAVANSRVSLESEAHAHKTFMLHKAFYCAKLSNKQSAKVICMFDRLRTAHRNRQTSHMSIGNLFSAHAIDYIVVRVNYGLTGGENLAMAL